MKRLFLILFLCFYAFSVRADFSCSNKPTCESLGYVKESSARCVGQAVLRCPFDDSYVFCGEDTVELNCKPGDYFDIDHKICYEDDTVSDYVFVKYNELGTKAYLFSLSEKSVGTFDSYQNAISDNLAHLLTREMFGTLSGSVVSPSILGQCIRVRNGETNEIIRTNGNVVSESSFASICSSYVSAYYYIKASLY